MVISKNTKQQTKLSSESIPKQKQLLTTTSVILDLNPKEMPVVCQNKY